MDQAPLEYLLTSILTFHIFILFLLIILLILIFNKYILHYNLDLISSISKKYLNGKIYDWFENKYNKSIEYNNRFIFIMFIWISIALISIIFFNIYITTNLLVNIADYVHVYNYIHGMHK